MLNHKNELEPDGAQPKNKKTIWESWGDTIILSIVAVVSFIFFNCVVSLTIVPSGSMIPTIQVGDFQIGYRLAYMRNEPERGDIVVFYRDTDTEHEKLLTKRIIGLPGDRISINGGVLYINGEAYEEDYVMSNSGEDFAEVVVPEGKYLMLGDNRYNSADGREWEEHFVSRENIISKCILIL